MIAKGFRYCPWCAAPQRLKLVEFYAPHQGTPSDHDKALRVSRYLGSGEDERHVRFSVWGGTGEALSAVSIGEEEADKLAQFLLQNASSGNHVARSEP
jgi:hypothetical protein